MTDFVCWHYASLAEFGDLPMIHFSLIFQGPVWNVWQQNSPVISFLSDQTITSISVVLSSNRHKPDGSAHLCPWSSLILWTSGRGLHFDCVHFLCGFPQCAPRPIGLGLSRVSSIISRFDEGQNICHDAICVLYCWEETENAWASLNSERCFVRVWVWYNLEENTVGFSATFRKS